MKKLVFIFIFLVIPGYALFAQPANDSQANAFDISNAGSWTSTDAAYTNVGATADGTAGTCVGKVRNVWFKFLATTNEMDVRVHTGGAKGTLTYPNLTLYNSSGNPIQCKYLGVATSTVYIQNTSLTPGSWYYISVDQYPTGSTGTFTLTTNNDIGYDLREKAVLITGNNWSSGDATYSNAGATADGTPATCVGTVRNVWFKFQATTNEIEIKVSTGGLNGTLTAPHLSLYNAAGSPLQCKYSGVNGTLVHIQNTALTVGAWYYVSVDQYPTGNPGTFTITTTNEIGYDLQQKALTISGNSWSSGDGAYNNVDATPDGSPATCVGVVRNVWFKFQATTNEMEIKVVTGGSKGTLGAPHLSLYSSTGVPIQCKYLGTNASMVYIQTTALTVDSWYFISVDQYPTGNAGTFTISANNNIGYDLREKAELITGDSWTSGDGEYTNVGATADGVSGTCVGTVRNVWFKFLATTNEMEIRVQTGGTKGTLMYHNLTLYNSSGSPLKCKYLGAETGTTYIQTVSLTVGSWYYFSVDQYSTNVGSGTFTVSTTNSIGYDLREKAELITGDSWTSEDGEYTNVGATADGVSGTCVGTVRNVWFKFLAVTNEMDIRVQTGGTKGTLMYHNLTLYNSSGSPLKCKYLGAATGTTYIQTVSLTVGSWYYFSVDQYSTNVGSGTFTVSTANSIGYDLREKAKLISSNNWSSDDASYSNVGATADGVAGTCVGTLRNVWFKFLAITNEIDITLYTGGVKGTLVYPAINLYNAAGSPLQCKYQGAATVLNIRNTSLTIGSWYYISVDQYAGNPGSFSLAVNNHSGANTPKTFYSIANGQWHDPATWSLTDGGAPSAVYPEDVDIVYVKGFAIDVTEEVTCTELNIILTTNNTSVKIEGNTADLTVINAVNIKSNGPLASNNGLVVGNNGKIAIGSN